jgi:hypothetical protein
MPLSLASTRWPARLDGVAVTLSSLCVLHCLALPVLLALLPALGATVLAGEDFHRWLLLAVVPTSALALTLGCCRHRAWQVAVLGAAGLLPMFAAAFGADRLALDELGERVLTVSGALLVASAHLLNYRRCRGASRCDSS